jgi:uncharacterized membrane protein
MAAPPRPGGGGGRAAASHIRCRRHALAVVRAVVAAARIPTIVIAAIVPAFAAIVGAAVVPGAVVHLVLALLMVGRIVAATVRLSDGWNRDGTGESERGQGFRETGVHVWIPPVGIAFEASQCRRTGLSFNGTLVGSWTWGQTLAGRLEKEISRARRVRNSAPASLIGRGLLHPYKRGPMRDGTSRRLDPLVFIRGLPGHPLHPPLTDATIGMYVLAAGLAVIGYAGGIELAAAKGMWLALIGGLIVSVPTAATGLIDWLGITWGSPRWRTATWHLTAMLSAVALFALAAWRQYHGYQHGHVTTAGLVLTLCGAGVLTLGGWLGGSLVFVHATRVLGSAESTEQQGPTEPQPVHD